MLWSAKSELQMWVSKGGFFGVLYKNQIGSEPKHFTVFCGPKLEEIDQVHFSTTGFVWGTAAGTMDRKCKDHDSAS